jgi:4-hydroxy-3-methylbut-2-enyl diphosphate reductase
MSAAAPTPAAAPGDAPVRRVLVAKPRGYCAGVDRAVLTVEKALEAYGAPVYVRKQIVHNAHVVRTLEAQGAIFVEETEEVPEGATVVFSAHGVAPTVHAEAQGAALKTIDATCPLVTKVHMEAQRFAPTTSTSCSSATRGHEEVVGTTGPGARAHPPRRRRRGGLAGRRCATPPRSPTSRRPRCRSTRPT